MTTAYDRIPYPAFAHPKTRPVSIGAFATLCGRRPAPAHACRVLEIACGEGANLLGLAVASPGSDFVGFDLAKAAITRGRELAAEAQIGNVTLAVGDICNPPAAARGLFDYVIAHGVYAWVPAQVRLAIMELIGRVLAPDGVAFVSYNALPGCRVRQAIRDVLLEALRDVVDPAERLAAAKPVLAYQVGGWSEDDPFQRALIEDARGKLDRPPELLFHDELGEVWEPQLLADVIAAARARGLEYLCDGSSGLLKEALFPSAVFEAARSRTGGDWVRFEQWLDLTDMRPFRWSMFGRAGAPIERRADPARLEGLFATSDLRRCDGRPEDRFSFGRGEIEIGTNNEDLNAVLGRIADAYPGSVPLAPLRHDPILTEAVLRLFVGRVIDLETAPPRLCVEPRDRPVASPLARAQMRRGDTNCISLTHRQVTLSDPSTRCLLELLDGERDRAQLAREMASRMGWSEAEVEKRLPDVLAEFTRLGLLLA